MPSDPADLRSLLRAGELVTVPLTRRLFGGSAEPEVPLGPIEVALELGVSIVPVAMTGLEATRRWRVCIGEPLTTRRRVSRRGPAELAGATQVAMGQLLSRSRGRRLIGV